MPDTLEQIETEALTELERQHYEDIKESESKCYELEDIYETDKAQAASSKKRWDQSTHELRSLIRRGPDAQSKLEFPDDWRTVLIGDAITLTDAQSEKLSEVGVKTVEEFENLRAGQMKEYPGGLLDLPRVGQATIDKWEGEIVEWMSSNANDDSEPDGE